MSLIAMLNHSRSSFFAVAGLLLCGIVSVTVLSGVGYTVMLAQVGFYCAAICLLLLLWRMSPAADMSLMVIGGVLALLLFFTALSGAESCGMARWLLIGPLRINVMSFCTPALLAVCARLVAAGKVRYAVPLFLLAGVSLAMAPDVSQCGALLAGYLLICWDGLVLCRKLTLAGALLLAVCCGLAAQWDVSIPPVGYVEGVMNLAFTISPLLGVAACLALCAVVLLPLLWAGRLGGRACAGVAAVLAVPAVFSLSGNWPVPLIGYGAAPVLGTGLTMGLMLNGERGQAAARS